MSESTNYTITRAGLAYHLTDSKEGFILRLDKNEDYSIHIIAKNKELAIEAFFEALKALMRGDS